MTSSTTRLTGSSARRVASAGFGKTPRQTADEAQTLHDQVRAALQTVSDTLPGAQWRAGRTPTSWPTSSLAELARRGLVEYARGGSQGAAEVTVRAGDAASFRSWLPGQRGPTVAAEGDEGTPLNQRMYLIRPDTAHLDPWFLAGFLTAPLNVARMSSGTSAVKQLNVRTLTVPLLPLPEQRRYAAAFRALRDLQDAVSRAGQHAAELTQLLAAALTEGTLLPPEEQGAKEHTAHSITGGSADDLE